MTEIRCHEQASIIDIQILCGFYFMLYLSENFNSAYFKFAPTILQNYIKYTSKSSQTMIVYILLTFPKIRINFQTCVNGLYKIE